MPTILTRVTLTPIYGTTIQKRQYNFIDDNFVADCVAIKISDLHYWEIIHHTVKFHGEHFFITYNLNMISTYPQDYVFFVEILGIEISDLNVILKRICIILLQFGMNVMCFLILLYSGRAFLLVIIATLNGP